MTAKFTASMVAGLSSNSSKDEEIEVLRTLVEVVPQGTYLAGLLSAELLNWFESNTRNDFPSDVMEHISFSEKNAQILEERNREMGKERDDLQAVVETKRKMIETLQGQLTNTISSLNREREEWGKYYSDLRSEMQNAEAEIEALRDKVTALKVLVFDLEHPVNEIKD